MPRNEDGLLTDTELMLMNILWSINGGTVKQVLFHLPQERKLAYTSVSTILRILEKKDILQSTKEGKSHIYLPKLTKEAYQERGLNHLVSNVFKGETIHLVKTLLDTQDIKNEELKSIELLLKKELSKD